MLYSSVPFSLLYAYWTILLKCIVTYGWQCIYTIVRKFEFNSINNIMIGPSTWPIVLWMITGSYWRRGVLLFSSPKRLNSLAFDSPCRLDHHIWLIYDLKQILETNYFWSKLRVWCTLYYPNTYLIFHITLSTAAKQIMHYIHTDKS